MSHTLSIRVEQALFERLEKESRREGVSVSAVARRKLEAHAPAEDDPLMKFFGTVKGLPKNASTVKGFGPRKARP